MACGLAIGLIVVTSVACETNTPPHEATSTASPTTLGTDATPNAGASSNPSPSPGQLIAPTGSAYEIRYTRTRDVRGEKSFRLVIADSRTSRNRRSSSPAS